MRLSVLFAQYPGNFPDSFSPDPRGFLPAALRRSLFRRGPPVGPEETRSGDVKYIIAAIKPYKLDEVREALTAVGVRGMMVSEIKGFGTQSGHTEIYRGAEYAVNFVPKVKIEIAVADTLADEVTETIRKVARTDKIGDGKIFVLDLEQALRVRTGETGEDAL
jgi:nitrogen regulatory protein P-II 1